MRLVRVSIARVARWGLVEGDDVYALQGTPFNGHRPQRGPWLTRLTGATLLPPTTPTNVIAIRRNYITNEPPLPEAPSFLLRPASALIGMGAPVIYPVEKTQQVDQEAELALVIGRRAAHIAEAEALIHIFGYTCAVDLTARDVPHGDGLWWPGKCFPTFTTLGPWLETELDPSDLRIQARINGEIRQDGRTRDMLFKIPQLVSAVSRAMTLEPGDVILTGTPSGTSSIHPGDVLEVEIEGLGVLRHPIIAG